MFLLSYVLVSVIMMFSWCQLDTVIFVKLCLGYVSKTIRNSEFLYETSFDYRLRKQNETTLRIMSSNLWECTDPSTGNVCFFRFGTMNFKLREPAVPYNDNCLASKTQVLTSGKRQFLAMVNSGSRVGNCKFQFLGTGS